MSTPVSGSASYCTATQFLNYVDWRQIAEYLSREGVPRTYGAVLTDTSLAEILLAASGEVESACQYSGRYTPTDLAALTGNSAAYLRRIVAGIAHGQVLDLRELGDRPVPAKVTWARERLEQLRKGEMIFGLQEVMDAGDPETTFVTEPDIQLLNPATYQASRYYGTRANRNRFQR